MLTKEAASPTPSKHTPEPRPRPSLARKSYQKFSKTRKDLMRASSRVRMQSRAVEFRRIWWDKNSKGATRLGMSIWRPSPPSGYTSLGRILLMIFPQEYKSKCSLFGTLQAMLALMENSKAIILLFGDALPWGPIQDRIDIPNLSFVQQARRSWLHKLVGACLQGRRTLTFLAGCETQNPTGLMWT